MCRFGTHHHLPSILAASYKNFSHVFFLLLFDVSPNSKQTHMWFCTKLFILIYCKFFVYVLFCLIHCIFHLIDIDVVVFHFRSLWNCKFNVSTNTAISMAPFPLWRIFHKIEISFFLCHMTKKNQWYFFVKTTRFITFHMQRLSEWMECVWITWERLIELSIEIPTMNAKLWRQSDVIGYFFSKKKIFLQKFNESHRNKLWRKFCYPNFKGQNTICLEQLLFFRCHDYYWLLLLLLLSHCTCCDRCVCNIFMDSIEMKLHTTGVLRMGRKPYNALIVLNGVIRVKDYINCIDSNGRVTITILIPLNTHIRSQKNAHKFRFEHFI